MRKGVKHISNIKFDDNTEKIDYRNSCVNLIILVKMYITRIPLCVTRQK